VIEIPDVMARQIPSVLIAKIRDVLESAAIDAIDKHLRKEFDIWLNGDPDIGEPVGILHSGARSNDNA
jgi:hypothetical protein